jgi:hypothetical protein
MTNKISKKNPNPNPNPDPNNDKYKDRENEVEVEGEIKIEKKEESNVKIEAKVESKIENQDDADENDPFNLSGNCINSIDLEEEKNYYENFNLIIKQNSNDSNNIENENENEKEKENKNENEKDDEKHEKKEKENEKDISIKILFEENLMLKKENEILQEKIISKNCELSKINHEKYSLFFELKELLRSLEIIDLKKLNNFYLSNIENVKDYRKNISSFMGIKFNIMSAYTKFSYDSISNLLSPKNLSLNKYIKETNNSNDYINSKYIQVLMENIKKYDTELDEFIDYYYKKY